MDVLSIKLENDFLLIFLTDAAHYAEQKIVLGYGSLTNDFIS